MNPCCQTFGSTILSSRMSVVYLRRVHPNAYSLLTYYNVFNFPKEKFGSFKIFTESRDELYLPSTSLHLKKV